jgi:hypothetical protein
MVTTGKRPSLYHLSGTVAHSGWQGGQGHWQAAARGPHLTPAAGRLATAPLRCDDDSDHAGMLLSCTASDSDDVQVYPSLNHGRVVSIMPRRAGCLWDLGFA